MEQLRALPKDARRLIGGKLGRAQHDLIGDIKKLKGFKNPFRVAYTPVNLAAIDALGADEVTVDTLVKAGVVRPKALVKILGQGTVSRAVRVSAHSFSKSAEAAITAAGGTVERVPLPYAQGRPPAAGNALMNR